MTLKALNDGLGLNNELALPALPIRSPAQILSSTPATAAPEAKGYLEKRDWVFNRVSNIVTVRSDTFSVYGTAQLFTVEGSTVNLAASRRFWAPRSLGVARLPAHPGRRGQRRLHAPAHPELPVARLTCRPAGRSAATGRPRVPPFQWQPRGASL